MAEQTLKPGQKAPDSGQYAILGVDGTPTGAEITAIKDKPLPPTKVRGQGYRLKDPTKHAKKST